MSHLGLKILYHILNSHPRVAAERVYIPGEDYTALLEEKGLELCSLESQLPLSRFDLVGFTLQYELSYTNILHMLRLGGIPLRSEERDEGDPFIIAGGPCAYNPEPLADYLDAVVLGDGEEVILEIVEAYREHRKEGGSRVDFLRRLAGMEGLYIPSLFSVSYDEEGGVKAIRPLMDGYHTVTRRVVGDLNAAPHPTEPVVPFMEIVHDRVSVEVARGCTRGCRFCQAGCVYRPVRERSPDTVREIMRRSLEKSGYQEASLSSLSIGDYSGLSALVPQLMAEFKERCTALSLPSLRPGTLDTSLLKEITRVRKTGFTLAPEAGTRRLRRVINKDVSDDVIMENLEAILTAGWDFLKLYFMIGLPTEGEEDLLGIVEMCRRIMKLRAEGGRSFRSLHVALSSFVPKAHTPFQWMGMANVESIREKQDYIKKNLRGSKFNLKWHQPEMSYLEAVFARGDRRLGRVLERATLTGCRCDGWSDQFNFESWLDAFEAEGLDPDGYAHRSYHLDRPLPWDHLGSGVHKAFLTKELERSLRGEVTADCIFGDCDGCGVNTAGVKCPHREEPPHISPARAPAAAPPEEEQAEATYKYRLKYVKGREARFLSHLEIVNAIYRACRRARLPLEYSKGFHPHPKMSFSQALPVGVESLEEQMDITLKSYVAPDELTDRLNVELPPGLRVNWAAKLPFKSTRLPQVPSMVKYEVYLEADTLRFPHEEAHRQHIDEYLTRDSIVVVEERKGALKEREIRPLIDDISLERWDGGYRLEVTLDQREEKSLNPWTLLKDLYKLDENQARALRVVKTDAQLIGTGGYALRNRD
jgi:radical SAM family uncharacterized protein/radical SAM-linked protein